jgi:hypothetical protein
MEDEEIWNERCRSEYRESGGITFSNGKVLTGKEALDLYKFLTSRSGKTRRKITNKPEDYLPKETKA